MPIHAPGVRRGSKLHLVKRDVVAVLQLTAMVDLFTVLVVFLLQNYAVTDQILPLSDDLALPQAQAIKELKPSHVVIFSNGEITLNTENLGSLEEGTSSQKWVYTPLKERMIELIRTSQAGTDNFLLAQLKKIKEATNEEEEKITEKAPFRVTIQADENTEFVYIKRIMFTLAEAGIKEMNFAVIQKPKLATEG